MSKFVSDITAQSHHRWRAILSALAIPVPSGGKHGACPACGGKDRFRFDDKEGQGTWFCNQCGHGDGLDLVARVKNCDLSDAAKQVAALTLPASTAPAREKAAERPPLADKIKQMLTHSRNGESAYLKAKGFSIVHARLTAQQKMRIGGVLFDEGSLLLKLHRVSGELIGAQLINDNGEKRLLPGSQLKGAFIAVHYPKEPDTIVITEGYATGLTISPVSYTHLTLPTN